jgi:hypothetical protein
VRFACCRRRRPGSRRFLAPGPPLAERRKHPIRGMSPRSRDRSFESRSAPQLIAGFVNRAVEDIGVQGHDVIGVQVKERCLVPLVGHASGDGVATVVAGENLECLPMLGDEALSTAADQVAQLIRPD